MSQAPLDAFRPPGDRLVISPSVCIGTTLVPWRWDVGDNRKVCPTSKQGGIRLEGIWFSKSEITRQHSHSVLLFSSTGLEKYSQGEKLGLSCICEGW